MERHGTRLAWAADELFRTANLPLPKEEYYEDYPLLEDGIGMLRLFRDRFSEALSDMPPPRGEAPRQPSPWGGSSERRERG